jgi:hypothetical protein
VELTQAPGGFVEIKLADGRRGFLDGEVAIFRTKTMFLRQGQVSLYAEPSLDAPIVATLEKDARVRTRDAGVERDGIKWLNVSAEAGHVGYMRGDVEAMALAERPRIEGSSGNGFNNVLIGGAIFLIGIVVTVGSYSAVSHSGGSYLIAWGAILFGGIRLVKGLGQMNAST